MGSETLRLHIQELQSPEHQPQLQTDVRQGVGVCAWRRTLGSRLMKPRARPRQVAWPRSHDRLRGVKATWTVALPLAGTTWRGCRNGHTGVRGPALPQGGS